MLERSWDEAAVLKMAVDNCFGSCEKTVKIAISISVLLLGLPEQHRPIIKRQTDGYSDECFCFGTTGSSASSDYIDLELCEADKTAFNTLKTTFSGCLT